MFIKEIFLKNYRNHQELSFKKIGRINFITGPNAIGKSNLVEAILRFNGYTKQKDQIIKFGENNAQVKIVIEKNNSLLNYCLTAEKEGEKNYVNKKQPFGPISIIHFSPEEGSFFNGSPTERRSFLDSACSFLKKKYLKDLSDYQRVIRQKNNLLKEGINNHHLLESFNSQLINLASLIIIQRTQILEEIQPLAEQQMSLLAGQQEKVVLKYETKTDIKNIKGSLSEQLLERKELEYIRGCCLVGPHRDDFSLKLNDIDMSDYGSQGEKKTGCIALKIAQLNMLKQKGIKTLLILDDALSELDPKRKQLLLKAIDLCEQSFITATDYNGLDIEKNVNHIDLIRFK